MASKSNKKDAIDFVRSLQAEGGTNINDALLAGIEVVCRVELLSIIYIFSGKLFLPYYR
jgi:hypothetical protein